MKQHKMKVYLDSLRAGHSYLELLKPGDEHGDTFGFYPAKVDEKKEVLFGKGTVRKDCDRLKSSNKDSEVLLKSKTIELTENEYKWACALVEKQMSKPNWYFLLGYNCIDFIQNVHEAAKGKDASSFLELFEPAELADLSWVGVYARLEKAIT